MNYVKIKESITDAWPIAFSNESYWVLGRFFLADVGDDAESIIQSLEEKGEICVYTYDVDVYGDTIIIRDNIPPSEGEETPTFTTSIDQMVSILKKWALLVKQGVDGIIIYEKDVLCVDAENDFKGDVRTPFETALMRRKELNEGEEKNNEYVIIKRMDTSFYSSRREDEEKLIFSYESCEGNSEPLALLSRTLENASYIQTRFEWQERGFRPAQSNLNSSQLLYKDNKITIQDLVPYNKQLGQHPLESIVLEVHIFFDFLDQLLTLYEHYERTIKISYDGQYFKVSGHHTQN